MADAAKVVVKKGFSKAVAAFFEYDTPKIVHIKSLRVGIINRILQLAIISYIIGFAIIYKKGYQDTDPVVSAALTKVKGVVYTNSSSLKRIFDVADYVIPPEEVDAFFVMTNGLITQGQQQEICQEDPTIPDGQCNNNPCIAGDPVINGNGVKTGDCKTSSINASVKVCMVRAWCPVETDTNSTQVSLDGTEAFTVLIKNWIEFPKFGRKRRNIIDDVNNETYLQTCRYNAADPVDQFCPIFKLETILQEANEDLNITKKGGVIAIGIYWDCNLDYDIANCKPQYTFRRLDDAKAKIAKGWNFRYANYYYENGTQMRDLIKSTGIRFVIKVTGQAGKFNVVPLLLNIGSGLGLLAIASVLCDIFVLYVLKKGPFYQEKKYLYVTSDDAFKGGPFQSDTYGSVEEREPVMPSQLGEDGPPVDEGQNQNSMSTIEEGARNRHVKPGEYERLDE